MLGDANRLRIATLCLREPICVGNIAERVGLSPSLVSHHLRVLRDARFVKARDTGERHRRQQVWFTSLSGLFVAAGFAIHVWLAESFAEALRLLESHAGQPVRWPEIVPYFAAIVLGGRFVVATSTDG